MKLHGSAVCSVYNINNSKIYKCNFQECPWLFVFISAIYLLWWVKCWYHIETYQWLCWKRKEIHVLLHPFSAVIGDKLTQLSHEFSVSTSNEKGWLSTYGVRMIISCTEKTFQFPTPLDSEWYMRSDVVNHCIMVPLTVSHFWQEVAGCINISFFQHEIPLKWHRA